jgi:hypothetical protein
MTAEGIERYYETFFFDHKFDGKTILELKNQLSRQDNITEVLKLFDRLKVSEVGAMLKISSAIRKLK